MAQPMSTISVLFSYFCSISSSDWKKKMIFNKAVPTIFNFDDPSLAFILDKKRTQFGRKETTAHKMIYIFISRRSVYFGAFEAMERNN